MRTRLPVFLFGIFFISSLFLVSGALAQGVAVFGEIRVSGRVFVKSSDGQWSMTAPSYPLLQDTAIKTGQGTAFLSLKDGSQVFLSEHSEALAGVLDGRYLVNLHSGKLAFNIVPGASMAVTTPTASVLIEGGKGLVRKVSHDISTSGRTSGVVSVSEKGTEVRSYYGTISVSVNAAILKALSPGEGIFVGTGNTYRVFKVQTVKDDDEQGRDAEGGIANSDNNPSSASSGSGSGGRIAQAGIVLGFLGGSAYAIHESLNGPEAIASPSTLGARKLR